MYSLEFPAGSLGSTTYVPGAVFTTQEFDDVQPETAFYYYLHFVHYMSKSTANVYTWWPHSLQGTTVVVQLSFYSLFGGAYEGNVVCHTADDGTIAIPGYLMSSFSNDASIMVAIFRHRHVRTTLADGSALDGIYTFGLEGTAVLIP